MLRVRHVERAPRMTCCSFAAARDIREMILDPSIFHTLHSLLLITHSLYNQQVALLPEELS